MTPLASLVLAAPKTQQDSHKLWEFLEKNGNVVYPVVTVVVLTLIVGALLASWKRDELDAVARGNVKMKIMQIMRRRISGVSAPMVAAELQIDLSVAAKMLTELVEEGTVSASGGGSTVMYRIRGRADE